MVPEHAVAAVMTAVFFKTYSFPIQHVAYSLSIVIQIWHCLDEYLMDGTCCKQEFSGIRLEAKFKEMEECIAFNKTNTYHGTKWDENLRRWAREGM